ncbi:DRC2 protein, partial [Acromyrmex charruanus]
MWKKNLMREIELGTLNTKRYRTLWREMMTRIKMPQIAEDVKIAWHNFDRALDIKDYRLISFLMDELTEAEEQHQRTTKSYAEIIDRFLISYKERIQSKERSYRRTLDEILIQTNIGVGKIYYQQNEVLLQSIAHGVHKQLEEFSNNMKSIALSKIDAFVEDSKDIRRISVTQLENQLQKSWENLRRILSDYQNGRGTFMIHVPFMIIYDYFMCLSHYLQIIRGYFKAISSFRFINCLYLQCNKN